MGKSTGFGSDDGDDDSDEDDDAMDMRGLKGSKEGWGKKKNYYAGDTADLEIGQDVQDAYDEEEAAMSLQKDRLESMRESDYLDDIEEEADWEAQDGGRGEGKRKRSPKDSVIGSLQSVVLDEVSALI